MPHPLRSTVLPAKVEDAVRYLYERVLELSALTDEVRVSLFTVSYVAPSKPREGMIRFADGATWNPGSGRGLYQNVSGVWIKL